VTSAASAGCHRLIRDFTAVCVTNADEMAELAPLDRTPALFPPGDTDDNSPERIRLFDAISVRSPRHVADIAARSGLSLDAVRALLGALELEGEVAERERGWVRVVG
jgi:DNA processing protein